MRNLLQQRVCGPSKLSDYLLALAALVVCTAALALTVVAACRTQINADGGYYLPSALRILEGWKPYGNLELWYPPAVFYLFTIPLSLGAGPQNPTGIFLFQYMFLYCGALSLFVLAASFTTSLSLRSLVAGVYVLGSLLFEGNYVMLEPFIVCFVLASIVAARAKRPFSPQLAGIFFTAALFSKHYAVYAIPAIMVALTSGHNDRYLRLVKCTLTVAALSVVCICWLVFSQGATTEGLRQGFFPVQYISLAYSKKPVFEPLLSTFPIFGLLPILLLSSRLRKLPIYTIAWLGFGSGCIPLILRQWPHYFILFLPFAALLAGMLLEGARSRVPWFCVLILLSTFGYSLREAWRLGDGLLESNAREAQFTTCSELSQISSLHKPILLMGFPALSFTCNTLPPLSGHGYLFAESYSIDELKRSVLRENALIISIEENGELDRFFQARFESSPGEFFAFLRDCGFILRGSARRYSFWERVENSTTKTS